LSYSPPPKGQLSEWLKIMLGEVSRKQDEAARDAAEERMRQPVSTPTTEKKQAT